MAPVQDFGGPNIKQNNRKFNKPFTGQQNPKAHQDKLEDSENENQTVDTSNWRPTELVYINLY